MAVNLSRRWFLGGALAVAGATVLPSAPVLAYPRIIGDGVHDDTMGLQAALDGKTFVCGNQVMCGAEQVILKSGRYRITKCLRITRAMSLIGEHEPDRPSPVILSDVCNEGFLSIDPGIGTMNLQNLIFEPFTAKNIPEWVPKLFGTPGL